MSQVPGARFIDDPHSSHYIHQIQPQLVIDSVREVVEAARKKACALGPTIAGTRGDDVLTGTPQDDIICGRRGEDTISGLGGDDTLLGGNARDALIGGDG